LRCLVVNADDFGFTRDVNRGILEAHQQGILTATTLMANGDAFADAVDLAHAHPSLDIGVHLQMVQGPSVSCPGRFLPASVPALIGALLRGQWDILAEFRAQTEKILAAGIHPTHLDTHKHTHLLPPVLEALAKISREYGIRWVRRPFDLPISNPRARFKTRLARLLIEQVRPHFPRTLSAYGCRSTDHFAGFVFTGDFSGEDLLQLFPQLPEGSTEFMCHPGIFGKELAAAATRLKAQRALELEALCDPRLPSALQAAGIRLLNYRDLDLIR
jgi:chitin disaccharide deacetylase